MADGVSVKEKIKNKNVLASELVTDLPKWGVSLLVKEMCGVARLSLDKRFEGHDPANIDGAAWIAAVLSRSVFDPDTDEQVADDAEWQELVNGSFGECLAIYRVAERLSRLSAVDVEKHEKNSDSGTA